MLILVFIWTVEVYSLIEKTMLINLVFDLLVVVAYIRHRLRVRTAKTETESVDEKEGSQQPKLTVYITVLINHRLGHQMCNKSGI